MFKGRSFLVKIVNDKDAPEAEPIERDIDVNKIKAHFKKNQVAYAFAFMGIAGIMLKGRHSGIPSAPEGSDIIGIRPISILSRQTNNIVAVIEREGRGHPGFPVECIETGQKFLSQGMAAVAAGTSEVNMSKHINGKLDHINRLHYRRIPAAFAV